MGVLSVLGRCSVLGLVDSPSESWCGARRWVSMTNVRVVGWIAARRAELGGLEKSLVSHLTEVRTERDELAVAAKVWARAEVVVAGEAVRVAPVAESGLVSGRSVLLNPYRAPGMGVDALPRSTGRAWRSCAGPSVP